MLFQCWEHIGEQAKMLPVYVKGGEQGFLESADSLNKGLGVEGGNLFWNCISGVQSSLNGRKGES